MKCKYCDNDAEIKSYRDNNGQVGSEFVCLDCHGLANPPRTKYPFNEGDDYWCLEEIDGDYEDNYGYFQRGANAVQSCWDDQSELFYDEDPTRELFPSLDAVLRRCRDEYDFIKVSCFDNESHDIADGEYFIAEDCDDGKFKKSWND